MQPSNFCVGLPEGCALLMFSVLLWDIPGCPAADLAGTWWAQGWGVGSG